jgi:hypothetical protein
LLVEAEMNEQHQKKIIIIKKAREENEKLQQM